MSDVEIDTESYEACLIAETKEKDLTPEKDQYSSDSDSAEYDHRKNEILHPKTKEEKQKQNEEIVISSCSTSNFLPNDPFSNDMLNHNDAKQENHYFIDASSLLDEPELSFNSLTLKNIDTKPAGVKITKLKENIYDQEFTTEFETEIKVSNLEFKSNTDVPSTSLQINKNINFEDVTSEINSDLPSTSSERSYTPITYNKPISFTEINKDSDLPSSSSEKSYISLNSHVFHKNQNEVIGDFNTNLISYDSTIEVNTNLKMDIPSTSSEGYASLDSHILNKTDLATSDNCYASLDSHMLNKNIHYTNENKKENLSEKKTGFVRSGTFEIDSEELLLRKTNEKRQGSLIFQNSIQQFSGHSLDTDVMPNTPFNSIIHVNDVLVNQNLSQTERLDSMFYEKTDDLVDLVECKMVKSDTIDSLSSLCEAQIKREDSVPIISGGILPSDCEITQKITQPEPTPKSSVKSAWVVDMSTPPPVKSTSNDIKPNNKSSLGFFIDLTEVPSEPKKITSKIEPENDVKKNIFSMSIEFQAPKKGMPSRLSQSLSTKKQPQIELNPKNDVKKDVKKPEQNGVQLRHTRNNSNSHNRHSWNGQNEDFNMSSQQRTYSLSEKMSQHNSLPPDIKNIDLIHLEQENEINKCDINNQSDKIKKENITSRKNKIRNHKKITNHNINYSGESSNADESSNYQSGNDEDVRFNNRQNNQQIKTNGLRHIENNLKNSDSESIKSENDSNHSNFKNGSEEFQSHMVTSTTQVETCIERRKSDEITSNQTVIIINHDDIVINQFEGVTQENIFHSQVKSIDTTEVVEDKPSKSDGFVSLSDLDRPIPKIITEEPVYTRMTRSIPETSWIENKLLMSRSIGCRPSSKLLTNMSTSTPSFCFSNAHVRSGQESDELMSELSDFSSIQSSTALEISTEETSQSLSVHHHSNRLGTDLLRMFLEEIAPDLTISVAGRRLRAHKCILSSRCQYFAAMLSGGHVESAGNVISLEGFTFQAVYFAMCHIYSGAADIPESIDLVELATLADMLGLEGLKEVVASTLKVKYCHLFHKPCSVCVVGILETLQLAFTYSLDDLYRKCLKWITRYFVRVWATRAFASLTRELHDKCYQQHVVHMSGDSVLETMLCVDKLLATLPNVRWAEIVAELSERLKEDCEIYLIEHFASVLGSASFLSLGKELNWNISKLEESLFMAAESLSPEQACRSYARINKLQAFLHIGDECWSMNFTELVNIIQTRIESTVIRQAVRVSHTSSWAKLDPILRTRIQEMACLPLEPPGPLPAVRRQARSTSGSRNLDLRQIKLAMQQHSKRATSTESRVKKTQVMKPTKVVQEPPPPRPRTWPAQTQLKTKIISSSDSSRTSSPAMKKGAKKPDQNQLKPAQQPPNTAIPPKKKQIPQIRPKSDNKMSKSTPSLKIDKSKVKTPTVKQNITNSQKTIKPNNILKSNIQKVTKQPTKLTQISKENRTSNSQSKSGSNSSTQQSPSMINKNKQSSSNSTPSSQARSDSNPYSGSPSLRRSLLLAAKAPQVPVKPVSPATNKRLARIQASNSLTSPTKASAAKCVNNNQKSKPAQKVKKTEAKKVPDKPTIERSGTFLKDEPTVLSKA